MNTKHITQQDVLNAQKEWGEAIIKIGTVYSSGGDYVETAKHYINTLYGYELGTVLFKPTLASKVQFRTTFNDALSYFVGKKSSNEAIPEDSGFAIKPWINVRWENSGILAERGEMASAMGNYYFKTNEGDEQKVEYSFGYVKDDDGNLKIVLHHSSLPYTP